MNQKKTRAGKPLGSYTHASEKRTNLPTDQTERYMSDEQLEAVPYSP